MCAFRQRSSQLLRGALGSISLSIQPSHRWVLMDRRTYVITFLGKLVRVSLDENQIGVPQEFHVEDFSHIRQTPSPNWTPQNDKMAALDHWLETFRDSNRGASRFDLQILDEILPCAGVEGSR